MACIGRMMISICWNLLHSKSAPEWRTVLNRLTSNRSWTFAVNVDPKVSFNQKARENRFRKLSNKTNSNKKQKFWLTSAVESQPSSSNQSEASLRAWLIFSLSSSVDSNTPSSLNSFSRMSYMCDSSKFLARSLATLASSRACKSLSLRNQTKWLTMIFYINCRSLEDLGFYNFERCFGWAHKRKCVYWGRGGGGGISGKKKTVLQRANEKKPYRPKFPGRSSKTHGTSQ